MPIVPGYSQTKQTSQLEVEEAKAWVFNKSAAFEKAQTGFEKDLNGSIVPEEYARNPLSADRDNPNTYTNQVKDNIDSLLQQDEFVPPNKTAEDLWSAYTNKYKEQSLTKAIVAESAINMNGRKSILTNTINENIKSIEENPDSYELKQAQTAFAFEGAQQYMSTNTSFELKDKAEKGYHTAYMKGSAKTSPMKLMEEILSGKHNKMDKEEVQKHFYQAFKNYRIQARTEIKQLHQFVNDELAKIAMGVPDNLETLTMEDYYTDDVAMKIAVMSDWFGKNMTDKTRRTEYGESQRTAVEQDQYGNWYIVPTIRWDGKNYERYSNRTALDLALVNGDAVRVKDLQQGNNISNKMSRMLSYGD